jgi:alpha-1,2-mannosyltransferase
VRNVAETGGRPGVSLRSFAAAGKNFAQVVGLGVVPAALLAVFATLPVGRAFAFDFRQFWRGARDVVRGDSPYPSLESVEAIPNLEALGPEAIQDVFRFPYPAPAAVALAPFGALPFDVAAGIFVGLLVAATALTLYLLGVRDWRCYGAAFGSVATLAAVRLGTLTPLLALGVAAAWRYRDRRSLAAALVAAVVLSKLFLWPLLVWLVATRRTATAALAVAIAAAATVVGWAVIGFAGFRDYPELVAKLGEAVDEQGYSLVALAAALELPATVGRAAVALAAVAGVAAIVAIARTRDGERRALVVAIGVAVLASPIVWLHYFMLLLVPIALSRRRLAPLWLLPLAFWATPFQETDGEAWRIVAGLAIFVLALAAALRPAERAPEPAAQVVSGA